MQKLTINKNRYLFILLGIGLYFPSVAFAVPFIPGVPVEDVALESAVESLDMTAYDFLKAFNKYTEQFKDVIHDNENSSIRALLSLNPPAGEAAELYLPGTDSYAGGGKTMTNSDLEQKKICARRIITNPLNAKMTKGGAWEELLTKDAITVEDTDYSSVTVNDSTSITCLLQEIVEYDKLRVNLQIHSLLRDYINSALAQSLAQRTAGTIAKANIDWAKKGNVRTIYDDDGTPLSQEYYDVTGSDPEGYKQANVDARVKTINKNLITDKSEGDSLGACKSLKYTAAQNLLKTAHKTTKDEFDSISDEVGCSLTNELNPNAGLFASEDDLTKFYDDPMVGNKGPLNTLGWLLRHPENTQAGLDIKLEEQLYKNKLAVEGRLDREYIAGGGYLPSRQCDINDPYCDIKNSKIVIPSRLASDITSESALQQFRHIQNSKTAEDVASGANTDYSVTEMLNKGLDKYDTENLMPNQNISRYVSEFLSGIQNGYFDIQSGTVDWASGALLQIYDRTMRNSNAYTGSDSTQDLPGDVKVQME